MAGTPESALVPPKGCNSDCPARYVHLDWAGIGTAIGVHQNPEAKSLSVELCSTKRVIATLSPDRMGMEPAGQLAVYLQANIRWRSTESPPLLMPTTVLLETQCCQTRLDLAAATALAAALNGLAGSADPRVLAPTPTSRGWSEELHMCHRSVQHAALE